MTRWMTAVVVGLLAGVGLCAAEVSGLYETLSATCDGELIKGRPLSLTAEVVVVFKAPQEPARRDPFSFGRPASPPTPKAFVLKPEQLKLLVARPDVQAPPGVKVKIVSLDAREAKVKEFSRSEYLRTEYSGRTRKTITREHYFVFKGYALRCRVELTAGEGFRPGAQQVTIRLPGVERMARLLGATAPKQAPEISLRLTGWESAQARQAALDARANAERRRGWTVALVVIGAIVGLVVFCKLMAVLVRVCRRARPAFRLTVRPGESATAVGSCTREVPVAESRIHEEPELLTQLQRGHTVWGRRVGVTLEITGLPLRWQVSHWLHTSTGNGGTHRWHSYTAKVEYLLQMTASARPGTPCGRYLVESPAGWVVVEVAGPETALPAEDEHAALQLS